MLISKYITYNDFILLKINNSKTVDIGFVCVEIAKERIKR